MAVTFDRSGRPETPGSATLTPVSQEPRPTGLTYEPFYRGIMGMAVGYWGNVTQPVAV